MLPTSICALFPVLVFPFVFVFVFVLVFLLELMLMWGTAHLLPSSICALSPVLVFHVCFHSNFVCFNLCHFNKCCFKLNYASDKCCIHVMKQ